MTRMKGVSANFETSPLYPILYEDPRIRLRHQSLLQDYKDLYKETEAQKNKLEMMKQKKMTLLAEVRFLSQRYKYLMQNQNQSPEPKSIERPNLVDESRTARKKRNYTGSNGAARIDVNKKKKMYSERESPNFDLSQKQKSYIGKEAVLVNSGTIPDLSQKERIYSGKEAGVRSNNTPIFDLNQIAREEELEANGETMRIEEANKFSMRGGNDNEHTDMKLSACRTVGNGSSRAGKRKIKWQDQVALRV